ncbi:NfrA family protein [Enterovibrio sp. 27052020O]|uniref:NfrA family protein n=1 Tax=Enterovibrio sp. 27052020O TaxID=3241166 RepID=UPI003890E309
MMKRLLLIIVSYLFVLNAYGSALIMEGLSEFSEFRTYPYVDKAFELEKQHRYTEAEEEIEKALNITPEHLPFLRYQYLLLTKAANYAKAEQVLNLIPNEQREGLLFALRNQQLKENNTLTSVQFIALLNGLTAEEKDKLTLSYLYQLETAKGATQALDWARELPSEMKSADILAYEAEKAFELDDFDRTISSIAAIQRQEGDLNERLRLLLGLSYLAKGNVPQALALANELPALKSSEGIVRQHIENLVEDNDISTARVQYEWLTTHHSLTNADYKKKFELAIRDNDLKSAIAAASPAGINCIANISLYAELNQLDIANERFQSCSPKEDPENWLYLAEKLGQTDAIESQLFSDDVLIQQQRKILANLYHREQQDQKQIALLDRPQNLNEYMLLATAQQRSGHFKEAVDTWYQLFLKTGDVEALDIATTLAIEHLSPRRSIALIHDSLRKLRSEAYQRTQLDRLLALYADHPAYFNPNEIKQFNDQPVSAQHLANLWVNNDACDVAQKALTQPESSFAYRVLAYCIYQTDPNKALAYLEKAHAQQPDKHDLFYFGYLYTVTDQPEKALSYWLLMPEDQLSPNMKFYIAQNFYHTGAYEKADTWWNAADLQQSEDWWLLGVNIAISRHQYSTAELRLQQADSRFDSVYIDDLYSRLYNASGEQDKLIEFYETQIAQHPDDATYKAELAYILFPTDTERAVRLLEQSIPSLDSEALFQAEHQLAIGYSRLGLNADAKAQYAKLIDPLSDSPSASDKQKLVYLQSQNKQVDNRWQFSISETGGNDARNAESTLFTADQNRFLLGEAQRTLLNHDNGANSLSFKLAWLSSGEDTPFDTKELDIGLSWRPLPTYDLNVALGLRHQLDGDKDTNGYIRIYGDPLAHLGMNKYWQSGVDYWWHQSLYLDIFQYLGRNQRLLYGRYDVGPVFPIKYDNQHRLRAYSFLQADQDENRTTDNSVTRSDFRAGLGVGWLSQWGYNKYHGYNHDLEVDLEWQHIIDSDFYPKTNTEDAFMLRLYWHY